METVPPAAWKSESEPTDAAIFADLYPGLLAYAHVVAGDSHDPEGLVQEAIVRTLSTKLLSDLSHPKSYLRKAILNLVVDRARRSRRYRHKIVGRLRPDDVIHVDCYPSDLSELAQLPPIDRAVVYLRSIDQLPYGEIGKLVGCSEGAARVRHSRSLDKLRSLAQEPQTEPRRDLR